MDNELQISIDRDLAFSKEMWEKYSHDKEKMEEVYNRLLFNYSDSIDGFSHGLKVVSSYENISKLAQTYRDNVRVLTQRLEKFKDNGYSNITNISDDLYEYRRCLVNLFNQTRFNIDEDCDVNKSEKEELLMKIDEIEQITLENSPKEQRWAKIRPFIVWLSGKSLKGAAYILEILNYIGKER